MFELKLSSEFDKSFSKLEKIDKRIIWKKILQLEERAPLGKKLKGNPFWSIHIGRYRVIYQLNGKEILIIDILERKKDYRDLVSS